MNLNPMLFMLCIMLFFAAVAVFTTVTVAAIKHIRPNFDKFLWRKDK